MAQNKYLEIQRQIKGLQKEIRTAEQTGLWEKASCLNERLIRAQEGLDRQVVVDLGRTWWDKMTTGQRDIYPERPNKLSDFRIATSQRLDNQDR